MHADDNANQDQDQEIRTDINWEWVRRDLDYMDWEEDPYKPGTQQRLSYLGTVQSIFPSGKYYMPWACSNVSEAEAEADEVYREALEREAEEHGLFIDSGEGDPCDLYAGECRDTPEEEEDMTDDNNPTTGIATPPIDRTNLDEFTRAYVKAALWSSTDQSDDSGGEPMDANYGIDDIAEDTLREMIADCEAFQESEQSNGFDTIDADLGRAGHDFWLTRNHHGAGFWDCGWEEEEGERLTRLAHAYGEYNLFIDDNGSIYGC